MGNLQHNTSTVARFIARLGTTVFHILQYLQGIIYQFMALSAVNVYNHAHATCVVFIAVLIESLLLSCFHIILTLIHHNVTNRAQIYSKTSKKQTFF